MTIEPAAGQAANENAAYQRRGCDVCGSTAYRPIHRQRFALLDDGSGLAGYEVVSCECCGFVYADDLPDQNAFDRYYRDLSKYESHESGGHVASWAAEIHRAIVSEVSTFLPDRNTRILDVGAASGHLLAMFRKAGYENVVGFDPSPRCSELARNLYDIRVVNTPISKMAFERERFDLILFAEVLEHLRDVHPVVQQLGALLAPGGAIWFEVPDAGRFSQYVASPFRQFSLEHINFFTKSSLRQLMRRAGFAPMAIWPTVRKINIIEDPGLDGLFVARDDADDLVFDRDGVEEVQRYAVACERMERECCERIAPLIESGKPVLVWGTGSLTLHLLTVEAFRKLAIAAFVDANRNYQGKKIGGVPIISPEEARRRSETILVVSHASEEEIITGIRERYGLANPIVGFLGSDEDCCV